MNYWFILLSLSVFAFNSVASDKTIRIGVQPTGTLAWELAILQNDPKATFNFTIETTKVANAEAGKIALQSRAVDIIVSDWIWVSRLRSDGADFTFYPYSTTSGSLMVPEKSTVYHLKELGGKRLGIAGGELDKNWLLLQALAQKENLDLNATVGKVFGAPPLINEQMKQGRVDAALNYWHFGVALEAQGYRQLIDGEGIIKSLGIQEKVPSLGYVFKESWAAKQKDAFDNFLHASRKAKEMICQSESAWQKIIPLTQTKDSAIQNKLRQRYCDGQINQWGAPEQQAAEQIYTLLRTVSKNQLTGKSEHLHPGTFWTQK